jgi:TPR repeat protein
LDGPLQILGFFYKNGLYVKKDLNKALKYYQKGYKYGNLANGGIPITPI